MLLLASKKSWFKYLLSTRGELHSIFRAVFNYLMYEVPSYRSSSHFSFFFFILIVKYIKLKNCSWRKLPPMSVLRAPDKVNLLSFNDHCYDCLWKCKQLHDEAHKKCVRMGKENPRLMVSRKPVLWREVNQSQNTVLFPSTYNTTCASISAS